MKADYHVAPGVSREARDLLAHILVPDPDLRYGIKQIKQHKWYRDTYQPTVEISKGLKIGQDMPRAIPYILRVLKEEYQVDERLVRQCVEANRHNRHSAFYYLLYKKKLLEGELTQEPEEA